MIQWQNQMVRERDWEQFHSPKNLAMALAGEAGELLELFQWLSIEESQALKNNPEKMTEVRHEIADILYYVCRFSSVMGFDLEQAFWEKMEIAKKKYPVHQAKGNAKKYTEFKD